MTMSKRKVFAVFDNGTNRNRLTHCLLSMDATIGNAVSWYSRHGPRLWNVGNVKLIGIISDVDLNLRYNEATPSLTLDAMKVEEVMEAKDCLVFSAVEDRPTGHGDIVSSQAASVVASSMHDGLAEEEEQGKEAEETRDDYPEEQDDEDPSPKKKRRGPGRPRKTPLLEGDSEADTRCPTAKVDEETRRERRLARELQQLEEFNPPGLIDLGIKTPRYSQQRSLSNKSRGSGKSLAARKHPPATKHTLESFTSRKALSRTSKRDMKTPSSEEETVHVQEKKSGRATDKETCRQIRLSREIERLSDFNNPPRTGNFMHSQWAFTAEPERRKAEDDESWQLDTICFQGTDNKSFAIRSRQV